MTGRLTTACFVFIAFAAGAAPTVEFDYSAVHDDAWWSAAAAHRERDFVEVDWRSRLTTGLESAGLLRRDRPPFLVGVYLVGTRAGWESKLTELEQRLAEGRINCVVVDAKQAPGEICFPLPIPEEPRPELAVYQPPRGWDLPEETRWSPEKLAWEIGAVHGYIDDFPQLVERLQDAGAYVIARVVVHYDRFLAHYDPRGEARDYFAVKDSDTSRAWVGHADSVWCDPFAEEAWDYHLAVALYCAEVGVDEIQFDYIRFPTEGDVLNAYLPHAGGRHREWAVNSFLERAVEVLGPTGVALSADVFGFSALYEKYNPEGQDVDDMAQYLDALSPMNYPSHFGSGFYQGPGKTWRLLQDCAAVLKRRLEAVRPAASPPPDPLHTGARALLELQTPAIAWREAPEPAFPGTLSSCANHPYLQAFDLLAPSNFTGYVRDQVRGALAGGADGVLFWHANSSYGPLWPALDPHWRPLPPPLNPLPKVEPAAEVPAAVRGG